jgi:predicted outer membrane protein
MANKFWQGAVGVSALFLAVAASAQTSKANPNQSVDQRGMNAAAATEAGTPQSNSQKLAKDPTNQMGGSGGSTAASGEASAMKSALSKADQAAVIDMAMANMAEVEMGKIAQAKGSSDEVKRFAQQMIDDHGKALTEVQALAQAKGVTLPGSLDAKHNAEAAKLNGLSGAAFDKAYMAKGGVADHTMVHAKLMGIEKRAKDADVKAMAAKMIPTVEQHLNAAKQMAGTKGKAKMPPDVGAADEHAQGKQPAH